MFARLLMGAALFAAPLAFGAVQAWAWAALAVVASLAFFLWSLGGVRQGALKIIWSPLCLPGVLFLLLGTFQFFAHRTLDPIGTRESLLKLVTDLLFFFLAVQFLAGAPPRLLRAFGAAVAFYTFALALLAIFQFFSGNGLIFWSVAVPGGSAFGPFVNRNHYAGLMEMLIPLAAGYVFSRPRDPALQSLLVFSLLVPIASLLLSGSRGGFISLLAEVLVAGVIVLAPAQAHNRRRMASASGLGLLAAAALFFWMDPGQSTRRLESLASVTHSPEVTLGQRLVVARDSLHVFRAHLWTGSGLGSFEVAYPPHQSIPDDRVWAHAHNDYAEVLAETGLAGALMVLGALLIFFRQAFRNVADRLQNESGRLELGAAIGCCGLLVHSFVDFNLHVPSNAAWFVVCLAMATSTLSQFAVQRRG
jgi:O-antigen ligase